MIASRSFWLSAARRSPLASRFRSCGASPAIMPCACCGKFVAEAVDDGTLCGWIVIPDDVLVEVPWGEYCDRMHGKWYFFLCDSCGLDAYDDSPSDGSQWRYESWPWWRRLYRQWMGPWVYFKKRWLERHSKGSLKRRRVS